MTTSPLFRIVFLLGWSVLSLGISRAEDSAAKPFREEGALYLEDVLENPIKLKVIKPANTYSSLKGERYLGTLRVDQEVTLLAVSDRAYRVRGKAQQGQINVTFPSGKISSTPSRTIPFPISSARPTGSFPAPYPPTGKRSISRA